jgi:hypothetical protein
MVLLLSKNEADCLNPQHKKQALQEIEWVILGRFRVLAACK